MDNFPAECVVLVGLVLIGHQGESMGYSTHYLGRLDIWPRLNPDETVWLRAFQRTHRGLHPDDPYAVPMNPGAEAIGHPLVKETGTGLLVIPPGPLELATCDWAPCVSGCCLQWRKVEKSNHATRELQYLIDHFLKPGAHAASDGRQDFEPFTFDHTVSGIIAAERQDGWLYLIRAEDNALEEVTLVPGKGLW